MELILHQNVRSIFSEKVRRVLAYKSLAWTAVEVPALPPKSDYVQLTGGYRRMPSLQIGADIYCDSALAIRRLEQLFPTPTVFPPGREALAEMIADWADHRAFKWCLLSVYPDLLASAPPAFISDRKALIPELDPERVGTLAPHALEQFKQFVHVVSRAVASDPYITGEHFSVADAACYHLMGFARFSPGVFESVAASPRLLDWMGRIAAFGGTAVAPTRDSSYALDVARQAQPEDVGDFTVGPDVIRLGEHVEIWPDDYGTERVSGVVVKLAANELAVSRTSPGVGEVAVHFPRLGFNVQKLAMPPAPSLA